VIWDYSHQDEWLIVRDVLVTGDLTYWSHAFQGSVHQDHYYVKISENDGQSWIILSDLSAMAPYPSPNGYNQWETPYVVDLSPYLGQVLDIAWQAVDGDGQGLWYSWSIDDCSVGLTKLDLLSTQDGYNIYRKDPQGGDFVKINTSPVMSQTYEDEVATSGVYQYFLVQASGECSEYLSSDTITVDVVTGITEDTKPKSIRIFPNPANDQFNITSSDYIIQLEIFDDKGVCLIKKSLSPCKNPILYTQNLSSGIYFVKIITDKSFSIEKVIIIK
jgi:hypothetical protein